MRLSTKGRYAVMAMLNLAIHDQLDTVTLADISRSQRVSLSYLEQLFAKLRKRDLVKGVRGPGGGYRLAKPLDAISIAQIITAVDEQESRYGKKDNQRDQGALIQQLWDELSGQLYEFLDGITLAELVDRPDVREHARHLEQLAGRPQLAKRSAAA